MWGIGDPEHDAHSHRPGSLLRDTRDEHAPQRFQ